MLGSKWIKRLSKLFIIVVTVFPFMSFQSCSADICDAQSFQSHGSVETVLATLGKFSTQGQDQSPTFELASSLGRVAIAADTACPDSVNAALNDTDKQCAQTGRNQVCYGHNKINASGGTPTLKFDKPGDIAKVSDLHTLELAPLSLDQSTWGIALLRLQASLPDSAPGQNVTILAFGDVEVSDSPSSSPSAASTGAVSPGAVSPGAAAGPTTVTTPTTLP